MQDYECDSCKRKYERKNVVCCGSTIGPHLHDNVYGLGHNLYVCKRCMVSYAAKQFPNSDIKMTV
jgi:hypothetical protein